MTPQKTHFDVDSIAMLPCDWNRVSALVNEISSYFSSLSLDDVQQRVKLLRLARSLTFALQTPMERILWHSWAEPALFAAMDTMIQLGVFGLLKDAKDMEMSIGQLSDKSNSDPILISKFDPVEQLMRSSRLMKHLASMEVVHETGPDQYQVTNLSFVLSEAKYADAFPYISSTNLAYSHFYFRRKGAIPGIYRLPEYFARNNYTNPIDPMNGPFQYANNTSKHWFTWAKEQENNVFENFNNHMSAYNHGRPGWMDPGFYPIEERLLNYELSGDFDVEPVTLVDVGGGIGHDLAKFLSRFPEAPGRFILQELPIVIKQARGNTLNRKIELMEYDFFTEQNVKGARAYYMHSVLHDWPNEKCSEILHNLKAAMKSGYSRLLIHENVIPDINADWQTTSLDIIMMAMVSSQERRESEWRQLIEAAGLKIFKIWRSSGNAESLIECELKEL
ncbi:S-adenosyl-L-methionine-dependent methyltransferase [Xylogone sp. PMI_703]|nr:S-adenosyl-L-methionine-dependent methyltransferase [Xylogone sp. PMI_703]